MEDFENYHPHSIMSEIMTVDKNSRISREDGCTGTGFIVESNPGSPLLLSSKTYANGLHYRYLQVKFGKK